MSAFTTMGLQLQFVVGGLRAQLPAVKQLFLSGQYRQCATTAQALLLETNRDEPHMHVAFLHFYIALSHHETARNMRALNNQRQLSLELAEKHYVAAVTSLSVLGNSSATELDTIAEVPDYSEDDGSMVESYSLSNRSSIDHKRASVDSDLTDDTSVYSSDESDSALPPTPKMFSRSPPSHNFLDDLTLSLQKSYRKPVFCSILDPQTERYNVNLTNFVNMLHSHIYAVRSLQEDRTLEETAFSISQGWHEIANTSSGNRCSGMAKNGPNAAQFVRGRAKLLPRKRFDATKYEELCRKALAEL